MTTTLHTDPNHTTTTYTQPTSTPTAKVKAVGYTGLVTTAIPLVVTLLALFNIQIDTQSAEAATNQIVAVIGAIVTLYNALSALTQFVAGYMKKSDTANGAIKHH